MLKHDHLIIRSAIKNPPNSEEYITEWVRSLIKAIDMKVLMGPYAKYSEVEGNRGLTVVSVIETSHIALHVWDETDPAVLQLDVYSCAPVNIKTVLDFIEEFDPVHIDYKFLDRSSDFIKLL